MEKIQLIVCVSLCVIWLTLDVLTAISDSLYLFVVAIKLCCQQRCIVNFKCYTLFGLPWNEKFENKRYSYELSGIYVEWYSLTLSTSEGRADSISNINIQDKRLLYNVNVCRNRFINLSNNLHNIEPWPTENVIFILESGLISTCQYSLSHN